MKIIFFGGSGDIGKWVISEIYSFSKIEKITVVGRSQKKYQTLLDFLDKGKNRISFLKLNLDNHSNLSRVIQGHDLVVNTSGPFYKYEKKIALAALGAKTNYIGICDDYDATQFIFGLHDEVQKNNLCFLTGIGWTPGLSGFLARAGSYALDRVDTINIFWAANSGDSIGMAVILHTLHIFSGKSPSFEQGSLKMVSAGSGKQKILFPKPIGKITVYNVGHPEPISMPQYFPGVSEITLKGGINEGFLNKLAIISGKLGFGKSKSIALFFQKTLPFWRRVSGLGANVSGIRVDVSGVFQEKACSFSYNMVGPMQVLTGLPMVVAIKEMANGKIKKRGVFSSESPDVLDRNIVFKEFEERNIKITIK